MYARTIGMLGQTHISLKKALNTERFENRSMWQKYVNIAVLNYNSSYQTNIGCEPSGVFHGPVPYKVLDIKIGFRLQKTPAPNSQSCPQKMSSKRQKSFTKMSARTTWKHISGIRRTMTKKLMP